MESVKNGSSSQEKTVCRYGKGCFRSKCRYHHPEPRTIDQPSATNPIKEGSMLAHITASFAALDVKRESSPAAKQEITPRKPRSINSASHEKRRNTPQSAKSTFSSSKVTPISHFREPCMISGITEFHDSFKAAGIMFIRHDINADLEVLLGIEFRSRSEKRLHVIGGKRDFSHESHFDVAAREFWEETGELVPKPIIHTCLSSSTTKSIWIGAGKFVLYLVSDCLPDKLTDITNHYAALTTKDEMLSLHWCKWNDLVSKNNEALPEQMSGFLLQIIDDLLRLKVMDSFETEESKKQEATKVKEDKIVISTDTDELLQEAEVAITTLLEDLIKEAASTPDDTVPVDTSTTLLLES